MRNNLSASVIRETISCVQQTEAEVISILCTILNQVDTSGNTACLRKVSSIIKKWPDCPPALIADELKPLVQENSEIG